MPGTALLRQIEPDEIVCPAGELLGSADCYCGVEQDVIQGQTNPRTLSEWCTGCYTACPSWRSHKEAHWADQHRQFDRAVARGDDPHEVVGPSGDR